HSTTLCRPKLHTSLTYTPLFRSHIQTNRRRGECGQQQDNAQDADKPGDGGRILAYRVMGEVLSRRSRADRSYNGLASSLTCRLALFLSEWANIESHCLVFSHPTPLA